MVRTGRLSSATLQAAAIALILGWSLPVLALEVPVTWDNGAPSQDWTDADNWNPSTAGGPGDVGVLEFLVTVPSGFNPVNFNAQLPVAITDFSLGDNSRLVFNDGTDLTVLRAADIAGIIDGQGGNFTACGTSATFTGGRTRVYGSDGSIITICAPELTTTSLYAAPSGFNVFTWDLVKADGVGTTLNLSSVGILDAGFNDNSNDGTSADRNYQHVSVTGGANVVLSGLHTVIAPVQFDDYLRFAVSGPGSILDLSSLSEVTNPPGGRGRVEFLISDASISLPAVQSLRNTYFHVSGGAHVSADGADEATYSSTDLFAAPSGFNVFTWDLVKADGVGTTLNLSSVGILDAGFNDNSNDGTSSDRNYHHVSVTDGASVVLSGLHTIIGPVQFDDYLRFTVAGPDSMLDLSSLNDVTIPTGGHGRVEFLISDAGVSLPAIQSLRNTYFHVSNGAHVTADGVDEATYSSTEIYAAPSGFNIFHWDLLKADGSGTILNLSSVAIFDAGFNDNSNSGTSADRNFQHVSVTGGASVSLSGVHTVIGPVQFDDYLRFSVTGPGSILDMTSLGAIQSAGTGEIRVDVTSGGHVLMGNLNDVTAYTTISLDDDSMLSLAGLQADSQLSILNNETGTVRVGGDFFYTHNNAVELSLGSAIFECVGDWQWLEVGGTDFDLQWQFLPDDNFGYRQLIVGQDGKPTVVQLVDLHDNLQPGAADALYLFGVEDVGGVGGLEGLRILGGSTLVIGYLNVYALLDMDGDGVMERTRLHDLFGPGETRIRFDHDGNDGYIIRPEISPPIGGIDARQTSNPDGSNPAVSFIDLVYLGDPSQLNSAEFLIEVSGGTAPGIASVTAGIDTVTLEFDGQIPPGETTKITHLPSGSKTCVGYLPGDVNASRASTAADITALINSLNQVPGLVRPLFATDVNRSGAANASDILRVIDLLNGAGVYEPWLNRTVAECRP